MSASARDPIRLATFHRNSPMRHLDRNALHLGELRVAASIKGRVDMSTGPATGGHHVSEDERILHKLGYAQELFRGMGGFQNFAISFTIISILAGCLTSYYVAFERGGPISVTWGWLI